jgi:regulator of cell morphogenesis and NO signaling
MTITPSTHVLDIVTTAPATIAVFQRHHIEFCCAGRVPLEEVCVHEGLDLDSLIDELTAATEPFTETRDWHQASFAELVEHIQATYHRPLYEELPRLGAMLAKVVARHGHRLPDTLLPLQEVFAVLERDLVFHMRREDAILFPAILRLAEAPDGIDGDPHPLLAPITVMERDHANADRAIEGMRALTSGYQPPDDACPTFRGLYYGLLDLEHRMRLHVQLENDVLFPRALELGRPAPEGRHDA